MIIYGMLQFMNNHLQFGLLTEQHRDLYLIQIKLSQDDILI